jgi:hypothetical protein
MNGKKPLLGLSVLVDLVNLASSVALPTQYFQYCQGCGPAMTAYGSLDLHKKSKSLTAKVEPWHSLSAPCRQILRCTICTGRQTLLCGSLLMRCGVSRVPGHLADDWNDGRATGSATRDERSGGQDVYWPGALGRQRWMLRTLLDPRFVVFSELSGVQLV